MEPFYLFAYSLTLDSIELPMQAFGSFMDLKDLNTTLKEHLEPKNTIEVTHFAIGILDAKYEKADLPTSIVNERCNHLMIEQRNKLLRLLLTYELLSDGTLGD